MSEILKAILAGGGTSSPEEGESPRVFLVKADWIRGMVEKYIESGEAAVESYRVMIARGDRSTDWKKAISQIEARLEIARVAVESIAPGPFPMSLDGMIAVATSWAPWLTADQVKADKTALRDGR